MLTKFSIALFASAVSATEWNGYHGGPSTYHHHHAPAPHTNPFATPATPPAAAPAVSKVGWFNQYQQYSTPWRQYVPHYNPSAVMTNCALDSGNVLIAQLTKQAPMVKAELMGLEADTGYKLFVREFGNIGSECADGGNEFNPLKELKYGVENPYSDKTRGRITGITTDASGAASLMQKTLLQNLSGKESLVGKSISLFKVVEGMDDQLIDCCVIGEDALPKHLASEPHVHAHKPPVHAPKPLIHAHTLAPVAPTYHYVSPPNYRYANARQLRRRRA